MDARLKGMRSESKVMTPNIIIGKNGLTEQVLMNIKQELSKNKLVKLKILQSYISDKNKNDVFEDIVSRTEAKVVHKIGFTITLTKK
ncbi:MAG: YhbY family RNA-binding protein [Candidatus Woesearchaeota archaeon]